MRVCLITYEFLPETGLGGIAALYTDLARALARMGHEVTVLSGSNRQGVESSFEDGIRRVRFGRGQLRPYAVSRSIRAFSVLRHCRRFLRTEEPFDVVETPDIRAETILVNSIHKPKLSVVRLVTPTFLLAKMNITRYGLAVDWMERQNCILSDLILADSKDWAQGILKHWRISPSKLRMCPIGIDLERIENVDTVPSPVGGSYVLFSGRLTHAKGPQVLALAAPIIFEKHPDCQIVFAGADTRLADGDKMTSRILQSIPSRFHRNVVFLGFIASWSSLVALYKGAAVCVKADSHGNHSLDAIGQMACGKPLVATRTEGNMDLLVHGQNGFLFERDNPSELGKLVNLLLDDEGLRLNTGRNALSTIRRRFSSTVCAAASINAYEEAIYGESQD